MRKLNKYISLSTATIISNTWLLTDDIGRRFLIDTGFPLERRALLFSLWRSGVRRKGDLTAIILTHRHCDHAGNAAWLRSRFDVPVFAHEKDAPILCGDVAPKQLKRGLGNLADEWMCSLEDSYPAKVEIDDVFDKGDWRFGFRTYPAYGHTEGSSFIYHEPSRSLFTGDSLLTGVPPLRLFERFMLAVPAYSIDVKLCHELVMKFLMDHPPVRTLCSGHGPAVLRQTEIKLERFTKSL